MPPVKEQDLLALNTPAQSQLESFVTVRIISLMCCVSARTFRMLWREGKCQNDPSYIASIASSHYTNIAKITVNQSTYLSLPAVITRG